MSSKMAIFHNDATQALVNKINETMLVRAVDNPCSIISPSAYDTAWVAMIGDPKHKYEKPMFGSCLEWILNNQNSEGFWGERDCNGNPTIDSLPATLACMVALKTWSLGHQHIDKGLTFIMANATKFIERKDKHQKYPRWFAIVFVGMVELARCKGLRITFDDEIKETVSLVFRQQQEILKTEKLVDQYRFPPLLSYLEVLPLNFTVNHETILSNLSGDGSLFRSPSATAAAFLATQNMQPLSYLCHLLRSGNGGVPSLYPIHWDDMNVYMVNQLQRSGLSKHFANQVDDMLEHIYREYNAEEPSHRYSLIAADIHKSSLAFQLLRLRGYKVSARRFCWFLSDEYALEHIEENCYEKFASTLYNLYGATNLMFKSEVVLKKLRSFTRRLLAKCTLRHTIDDDGVMFWSHLQEQIKCELAIPWLARMDHLEQREWIESANKESPLWLGKSSYYRISCLDDKDLLQLAKHNYELRQEVYQQELKEIIRWSKVRGLMDMGFAREKTTYCYFAIATASTSLPCESNVRVIIAKNAVLITVLDDYFDMEGSLDELQILAKAVERWNNKGLKGHSWILFDALDNFVREVAQEYFDQNGIDITHNIRKIWNEVISSWLTEARWSKTGQIPSMASYLETGSISVAAHLMVLQASCFLTPSLSPHKLNPSKYEDITKLLMICCRLLNDLQGYEREVRDGKINSILLYLKEYPDAKMEDAITYVKNLLEESKMKLLEHALMDEYDAELPKPCKMLHLIALKVFQMFYNSANHFDSKDSLLNDINKAIFLPLEPHSSFQSPKSPSSNSRPKNSLLVNHYHHKISLKCLGKRKPIGICHVALPLSLARHHVRMKVSPILNF